MRRTHRSCSFYYTIVALTLMLSLLGNVSVTVAQEKAGLLDGMVFVGETGKMGDSSGDPDELTFKEGLFHSKSCDPYGFGDGVYKATASGNLTRFWVETFSPTEGRITWKGTLRGEKLEGYFIWHRAPKWYRLGSSTVEYWFKAQLKK